MTEVKHEQFWYNLLWFIIWFFIGFIAGSMEVTLHFNDYSIDSTSQWVRLIQIIITVACGWRAYDYLKGAWFSRPWKKMSKEI